MPPTARTDPDFAFRPYPPIDPTGEYPLPEPVPQGPLGPLELLLGTWEGAGFNTIWRPHFPKDQSDRFLELNLTQESLTFTEISGPIPNRGLLQPDLTMFGVTYMQQIADATSGGGLHIEPGIWAVVPQTTNPAVPPTVVRMASIPHGTAILAQGTVESVAGGPQIPDNDIIPFGLDGNPPLKSDFQTAEGIFTELNLAVASAFRSAPPAVTEAMVENPSSVLQSAVVGQSIRTTTTLQVSTTSTPVPGGGTANTAFLQGATANDQGNADATIVEATFWIETLEDPQGGADTLQLQYSQTVMLDFNGLRWPHVTVGTLEKKTAPPA